MTGTGIGSEQNTFEGSLSIGEGFETNLWGIPRVGTQKALLAIVYALHN